MAIFRKDTIRSGREAAGSALREIREKKDLKVSDVSRILGIHAKYICAIESGKWKHVPGGVYRTKYISEYAGYLGISDNQLSLRLKQLAEEVRPKKNSLFAQKHAEVKAFIIPRVLRASAIMGAVVICLFYLAGRFEKLSTPPDLQILSPNENTITDQKVMEVAGVSESETQITINGSPVLSNQAGFFSLPIDLREGINTITITAKKKLGKENTIVKQVLVK